jgi:hypothetical protein
MKFIIILFLLSSNVLLFGQSISGTVFDKDSEIPVEYVNIVIMDKTGTVSDQNGRYILQISPDYYNDTLIFSCIGYHSYSIKVSDFLQQNSGNISLEKRLYDLTEVVIRPKKVRQKTLGNTASNKAIWSNWMTPSGRNYGGSILGYEVGLLMSNKRTSFLKEVNWNIAKFTYDTIVFRVNVYKAHKEMQFENILRSPVYVTVSKEEVKDKITVDLRHLAIVVEGDFLVTFEYVSYSGGGEFNYCCRLGTHYYRTQWQREWRASVPRPSIWTLVDVER